MDGKKLSPGARKAIASYSDDLLEALIDAICLETKSRGTHRISKEDVLKSVEAVSLFPIRIVPRATLKIFNPKASSDRPVVPPTTLDASQPEQTTKKPGQQIRPRRPVVDEAEFLEDIRKMKPVEIREPVLYSSHKLTLDAKDIRPLLGDSAANEASTPLERPIRHFVGRRQPLITEDRGDLQVELTNYYKYREYLGITGPMPNIKSKFRTMTEIPAYLFALQEGNEALGLPSNNGAAMHGVPQAHPQNIPIHHLAQVAPTQGYYERTYPYQQTSLNFPMQHLPSGPLPAHNVSMPPSFPLQHMPSGPLPPPNVSMPYFPLQHMPSGPLPPPNGSMPSFPVQHMPSVPLPPHNVSIPFGIQQALQSMDPHKAALMFHEFRQRQRRQKWVDDLERSALISPTPPLTEYENPLCSLRGHHHCVSSRKSADLTLSLTVRSDEVRCSTPPCTREDTPPDLDVLEIPEGPVDHIDCAEYYTRVNEGSTKKLDGCEPRSSSVLKKRELDRRKDVGVVLNSTNSSDEIVIPKPPSYLSAKEAKLFKKCVGRLVMIARGGSICTS